MASYYGTQLSPEQVAQALYTAGWRGEQLVQMVAISKRESSWNAGAHRTDSAQGALSGDRGLWQINYIWDNQLMAAGIIRSKADLFDPVTNAKAAKFVFDRQGMAAWGMGGNNSFDAAGDPFHRTNIEEARVAVNRAQAQGILGQDWARGPGPGAPPAAGSATAAAGPIDLPSDAKLIRHGGVVNAVFDLGGGVKLFYGNVTDPQGRAVQDYTDQQWNQSGFVHGGDVAELKTVKSTFGTFSKFWTSIIEQVIGSGNPAANDPGVRRVLAEFAGRPDMSEAELQNKLKATTYWKTKTEGQLAWNSLAPAEQALRRQETRARMAQTWFQFAGERVGINDPRINQHLEAVASGKMGFSQWTETFLKPRALQNTESPWAREVRTEQENQRQRGIDIENTANQVRDTLNRWGLRWSEAQILNWGQQIVAKRKSDKDLLGAIKKQAQVLFPLKDPELETSTYAAPWLEVYGRVMEQDATVFTKEIAKALNQGTDVWDFEQGLKKSSKWLNTRNAREELFSIAAEAGTRMGFA